jgi:two-component system, response regulator YesN
MMKSTLFRKLFISYILITLIPVTAFFTLLYYNSVLNLQSEVETFNTTNLYQIRDSFDLRIKELKNIAARISFNSKLSNYSMVQDNYRVLEGIEELQKYKAGNEFINEIIVYYEGSTELYSNNGTTSIETLLEVNYRFSEPDKQKFMSLLDNSTNLSLSMFDGSNVVIYQSPLPIFGNFNNGSALFLIRGSTIQRMISDGRAQFEGAILVLDTNNNITISLDNSQLMANENLLVAVRNLQTSGLSMLKVGRENYSVIRAISTETGWTYLTVMPTRQFFQKVSSVKFFIILFALVVITVCIIVALRLASVQYNPIQKINTFARDCLLQGGEAPGSDELKNIQSAVSKAITTNISLQNQLNYNRQLIRQKILIEIIKGESQSTAEFAQQAEACGIQLTNRQFAVMVATCISEEDEFQRTSARLLEFINRQYSDQGQAFAVELSQEHPMVIFVCLAQDQGNSVLADIARQVADFHLRQSGCRLCVGIGRIYPAITSAGESYIEALAAIESLPPQKRQSVAFFEDIVIARSQHLQSDEDELYLILSLKQGEENIAREALTRIFDNLQSKHLTPTSINFVCYRLVDKMMNLVNDLANIDQEHDLLNALTDKLAKLVSSFSYHEFKGQMMLIAGDICQAIRRINEQKDAGIKNHVIRYINSHFKDPNLSLDDLAGQFGYSNFYWSRFFKDKMGCLYSDYIWKLRIDEVKQQIVRSKKPLKDIVAAVGYSDMTSFIRRFKKEEGLTPGQYRDLYNQPSKSDLGGSSL